jgi:hypothetical protein
MLPDDRGRLWLATPERGPRNTLVPTWLVFDARGALTHRVSFPAAFQLKTVRGDIVAGVISNADGTHSAIVQLLPLR